MQIKISQSYPERIDFQLTLSLALNEEKGKRKKRIKLNIKIGEC